MGDCLPCMQLAWPGRHAAAATCCERGCAAASPCVAAELTKHPVEGFSAGLVDDSNIFEWAVTIIGPPDTL
jgi:hypothetical protein